jgi:DNA-binding response OmpR family regulator
MDEPINRILIVEDDHDLAEMLDAYFGAQQYEVVKAAWGKDGVKAAREEDFSLIMLDIRLPDIDGYDVCRQLRLNRRSQDTPIIFLTEKRERVDKLQGLQLGVVDYITKPFDIQELRLRVRNAIQRAEMHSLMNPVTQLPDVRLTDERLSTLIYDDRPWALVRFSILGLDTLRERHGFMAGDEMMRAVALLLKNGLREYGGDEDMMGHTTPEELLVFTTADKAPTIRERIETRIRHSLVQVYYPIDDKSDDADYLKVESGTIDHTGNYESVEAIKAALGVKAGEADL